MPLYEYHCNQCNHTFEVRHPAGQNGRKCPICNRKATKIFHAPEIIFKGSGFHVNDYCRDKGKEKPAPGACEKKSEGACAGCEE